MVEHRLFLGVLVPLIAGLAGCGGGGGNASTTVVGDTVAPALAGVTVTEQSRSVDQGVLLQVRLTATDAVGVTGVTVSLAALGGVAAPVPLVRNGDVWAGSVRVIPPLLGIQTYQAQAAVVDAAGNRSSGSASVVLSGATPPSTTTALP